MEYIGEIRMFGGNFAPLGWAFCNGQLLPISEYDALFNLIGTTYGGDGQETFALPDLQSRAPIHMGTDPASGRTYQLGETGGVESVTLTVNQIPQHNHPIPASTQAAGSRSAVGGVPAALPSDVGYSAGPAGESMSESTSAGGSQPHANVQPYIGISFIIALYGIYPSQS